MKVESYDKIANSIKDKIIYLPADKSYYCWNGRFFEADKNRQKSIVLLDSILKKDWRTILNQEGFDETSFEEWSCFERLERILKNLQGNSVLSKHIDEMNPDNELLNFMNGVLNLRTKELCPHNPEYFMTHCINHEYQKDSLKPQKFLRFLSWMLNHPDYPHINIINENIETGIRVTFLLQVLGASISGYTFRIFPFIIGDGANGKSVLISIMKDIFNTYCEEFSANQLLKPDTEMGKVLDRVKKARLLISSESRYNLKIAPEKIKSITGSDRQSYRGMYKENSTFTPHFSPLLTSNHLFKMLNNDHALEERICIIRLFNQVSPKDQNPNLVCELKDEYPGIIALLVNSCSEWLKNERKFTIPRSIKRDTNIDWKYITSKDHIKEYVDEFIEDCSIQSNSNYSQNPRTNQLQMSDIYAHYKLYCQDYGFEAKSKISLGKAFEAKGYTGSNYKSVRNWNTTYKNLRIRDYNF